MDLRPYLDELERFADGQMSEAEQQAFELQLEQEDELSAAYHDYEQFTADLRWVAGHETLRQSLENIDKSLDQRQEALAGMKRRTRTTRIRWSLVAAAVVVAALAGWLLRPHLLAPDHTWGRYYVPDPGLSEAATLGTSSPLLLEAMRHYRSGHYPAALHSLRRVPASTVGDDTLLYYTGVLLLRQGDAGAARSYLTRVTRQPASALAGKARYHLAMAQWRSGQLLQARASLGAIATDAQNPYQRSAQRALHASVWQPTK